MPTTVLLSLLRCPVAVKEIGGAGTLELVHDCWLVSPESGCKYPIVHDIPVILPGVGKRFKDTPVDALPVPPPSDLADISVEE
ncbi:MAG: hypothetical protein Kow00124_19440 [Anaerolineae bacterium]